MIKATVKFDFRGMAAYQKNIAIADQAGLLYAGYRLAEKMANLMQWTRSGLRYMWHKESSKSIPRSRPGEPPMIQTARLRRSISVCGSWMSNGIAVTNIPMLASDVVSSPDAPTSGHSVAIGSNVPYAGYLEWGTAQMAPRPFVSTAYRSGLADLFHDYITVIQRILG